MNTTLKKGAFSWTEEAQASYEDLKEALLSSSVLKMPDFTKNFIVEYDMLRIELGAILMQEGHPVAYFS